ESKARPDSRDHHRGKERERKEDIACRSRSFPPGCYAQSRLGYRSFSYQPVWQTSRSFEVGPTSPKSRLHKRSSPMRSSKLALCLGLVFAASTCFAQMYTVTDLGTLGGSFSGAFGINASGQVVGYSTRKDTPLGDT